MIPFSSEKKTGEGKDDMKKKKNSNSFVMNKFFGFGQDVNQNVKDAIPLTNAKKNMNVVKGEGENREKTALGPDYSVLPKETQKKAAIDAW